MIMVENVARAIHEEGRKRALFRGGSFPEGRWHRFVWLRSGLADFLWRGVARQSQRC